MNNDLAQLAACPLFGGLDQPSLEWLRARCRSQRLAKGQVVFAQGEPGDCVHVLRVGAVSISVHSPQGGEMVLGVLRPPSAFGEISLLDGGPRVAGATALVASQVFTIPREVVLTLLGSHPEVSAVLLASMVALIRAVDEQVVDLVLLRLSQRVAKELLREALSVAGDSRVESSGVLPVEFALNQSELARKVGASRQAVNRELAGLEHAGAIERAGHRVVAVRPERLALAAADAVPAWPRAPCAARSESSCWAMWTPASHWQATRSRRNRRSGPPSQPNCLVGSPSSCSATCAAIPTSPANTVLTQQRPWSTGWPGSQPRWPRSSAQRRLASGVTRSWCSSARRARGCAQPSPCGNAAWTPPSPIPTSRSGWAIGVDAGESAGSNEQASAHALNVGARLCAHAAAGEALASHEVTHLAGVVPGVRYSSRRPVRLKGSPVAQRCVALEPTERDAQRAAALRR